MDGRPLGKQLGNIEKDKFSVLALLGYFNYDVSRYKPPFEGLLLETLKDGMFRRIGYWQKKYIPRLFMKETQLHEQPTPNVRRQVIRII